MDRYAPLQIGREYDLTPTELFVVDALVRMVDKRGRVWTGTLTSLGSELRLARGTVGDALRRLHDCGLVDIEVRFRGHGHGRVRIISYDRWVVPWGNPETRTSTRFDNLTERSETRVKREPIASQSRDSTRFQSDESGVRGTKAIREEEVRDVDVDEDTCSICGAIEAGHPFDHEPLMASKTVGANIEDFEVPF
jgi:hypothetical protein